MVFSSGVDVGGLQQMSWNEKVKNEETGKVSQGMSRDLKACATTVVKIWQSKEWNARMKI
jgi:hypothetical protein